MIVNVNPYIKGDYFVATPSEALNLLRKSTGEKKMIIHGGTYYGTKLVLTKEDKGLIIEGYGKLKPILSGGILVSDWKVDEKTGWFYAPIPLVDGKPVDFRLLVSKKGDYLKKARYPLQGQLHHLSKFDKLNWRGSCFGGWGRELRRDELDNFIYKPEDFTEEFDYKNAEVQVYHSWNESYTKIVRMDKQTNTFYVDPPCGHPAGSFWRYDYVIYNTVEGMAEDGRWYRDFKTNNIYYRPFKNEAVEDFSAIVPITTSVIYFEDGASDIVIKGIDVTEATTPIVTDIYSTKVMRGAGGFVSMEQTGAIESENASNLLIENVSVYNTGGHGIKIKGNNVFVRDCSVKECGAGGVMLNLQTPIPTNDDEKLYKTWPAVENCRISNIGLDYYSGVAIFINNAVARKNYIEFTPYSGIVAYGDNVLIEDNIVLDPMQQMNDGAAIYKLLDSKGIIRNNFVQRKKGNPNLNFKGLYLDAPGREFQMYGNVVIGFKSGFHHHIAEGGTIFKDNYFEFDGDMKITFHRSKDTHLINNVFKCKGTLSFEAPTDCLTEFRGNVLRHGGESVIYRETKTDLSDADKPNRPMGPDCKFLADNSNSIERIQ